MITQEFNLNLIPSSPPVVVHVDQYDYGTGRLVASLFDGDTPYVPTNPSVYIQGTKPDGKYFISSTGVSIEGNVITADLIKTMTQVAGRTRTQFVVTEPTGRTGTFVFWLDVQETAMPDDSEISDTDISVIENAVETVQEAVIEAAEFAQASSDNKEDSEAWAKGTRNGEDVPSTDETYHNNAKYWAEQAASSASHGGHTIENEDGTAMIARTKLQFVNADVEDDAENDCTVVTPRGGTGGSKIVVTTSESSLHNKNVTISDGITTVTEQFSTEGVATFTGITMTGTLIITSTDGTETATDTINVPYYGSYTKAISFVTFNATINISTASIQMQGQTVKVYKNGTQIDTTTFSAGGSATYTAHETGTYKFGCVVDGYEFKSADVVVSAETTYNTTIAYFGATLSITTSSSSLYGKTITIKKGSTVVGTTTFSAQGSASYTVHETGTYTCECEGYSGSATVSAETTYNVTINAGLDLSAWITAGSTTDYPLNPSSYADFSALEADEAAVRQLMTVHASVDYLAQATAGDSLMQSVINSDVCAKWINISDYALDTLYANSDIADVMDTADKYGYGEWGIVDSTTTPPTWGAVGCVPIMTADNAPYGVASASGIRSGEAGAYSIFDGNDSAGTETALNTIPAYISYTSVNPIKVKRFHIIIRSNGTNRYCKTYKIQGSNDGFVNDVHDLFSETIDTGSTNYDEYKDIPENTQGYYMSHRIYCTESYTNNLGVYTLQFYGRELKPLVPTMTSNTTPKGEVFGTLKDYAASSNPLWKAFAGDSTETFIGNTTSVIGSDLVAYKPADNFVCKMASMQYRHGGTTTSYTYKLALQGSNDNFVSDVHDIGEAQATGAQNTYGNPVIIENAGDTIYSALRMYLVSDTKDNANGTGFKNVQFYGFDYSEKEFAQGSTRKTIYDHGVEVETVTQVIQSGGSGSITKESNQIIVGPTTTSGHAVFAEAKIPTTGLSTLYAKCGNRWHNGALGAATNDTFTTGFAYQAYNDGDGSLPDNMQLDVSQFTQGNSVSVWTTRLDIPSSFTELWLE